MLDDDEDMSELFGDAPDVVAVKPARAPKEDAKRAVRVGRLDTLEHISAEAAKLYRKARQGAGGDINAMTASRLASVLKLCGDMVQAASLARFEEIEKRLAELEGERKPRR